MREEIGGSTAEKDSKDADSDNTPGADTTDDDEDHLESASFVPTTFTRVGGGAPFPKAALHTVEKVRRFKRRGLRLSRSWWNSEARRGS